MKPISIIITCITMLQLASNCNAQHFTNYTIKDGLPSNFVYRATQDRDGFIWFLTDKGISKFDGITFRNFTISDGLPTNDIWKLRFTKDNRAWFFTRSDKLGYIENDSVFAFASANGKMMNPNGPILQAGNTIQFRDLKYMYFLKDNLWRAEIIRRNDTIINTKKSYLVSHKLIHQPLYYNFLEYDEWLEDEKGDKTYIFNKNQLGNRFQLNDSLFVTCNNRLYGIVNLNSLKTYSESLSPYKTKGLDNFNSTFNFNLINNTLQISENNWVLVFNDSLQIEKKFPVPKYLKSTHNIIDKDGFIWAATSHNGVYKLPKNYHDTQTLFQDENITLLKEINGILYVGVLGKGVYKITNTMPKLVMSEKDRLIDIAEINNDLLFSFFTKSVFYKFKDKNPFAKPFSVAKKHYVAYDNAIFGIGYNYIDKFDATTLKLLQEHTDTDYNTYQGLFVQRDTLFSFNYKNLLFYNTSKKTFNLYKEQQIQKKLLTNFKYQNTIYLGTEGDGLQIFKDGDVTKLISDDQSIINKIYVENNRSIWAISEGKLLHYQKDERDVFTLTKHLQINGFPTNALTAVYVKNNNLYLGTGTGLTILKKNELFKEPNFRPYIKSMYLNKKRVRDSVISFKYSQNNSLKVNFGAINYFDAEQTTYQYQMMPNQKEWITTVSGEVNLFNIQPDSYMLSLKVTQGNVEKLLHIPILITPLWWQKTSTKVGTSILGCAFIGLFLIVVRKKEIKKKMAKLTTQKKMAEYQLYALRSHMNPHFVFNSLAAIQYYINENDFETSDKYLVKFSQLIRQFFEISKQETIALSEEIKLLQNYLTIEKLRFKDKLDAIFKIDPSVNLENTLIPSMLLQPIVENAVNHGIFNKSGNGTIQICIIYKNCSEYVVEIIDDGVGITIENKQPKKKMTSSQILTERLEVINQSKNWEITFTNTIAFVNEKNKGNKARFIVKYNQ